MILSQLNSLPIDKISESAKLKAVADDEIIRPGVIVICNRDYM